MKNVQNEVSVIGLGMMGSTLAQLALRHGYSVTVWNRTSAKAEPLVRAGAVLAPSAAAAVGASPIVVVCVYDYKAASAILDTDEVASALGGRVVLQSGNYEISESPLKISVEATERLAQAAREGGINAQFPTFAAGFFKEAVAAGYENEEIAALIKVFRSASGRPATASHPGTTAKLRS